MTAHPIKIQSIEAARAVAALLVVFLHAGNMMRVEHLTGHVGVNNFFGFGYVGVDFFFVLSGFVIAYIQRDKLGRPGVALDYLWRRVTRIYPIYWFILLLTIAITLGGKLALGKEVFLDMSLADVPGTVFLLMDSEPPKYVGVAWSLQYEMMFYVMFVLLILNRRLGLMLFGVWAIFVLMNIFGVTKDLLPLNLDNSYCIQFLMGVACGLLLDKLPLRGRLSYCYWAVGFYAVCIFIEMFGPMGLHSHLGRLMLGVAGACVIVALVTAERDAGLRAPSWLVWLGAVSYSIYLAHIVLINVAFMILLKLGIYHQLPELATFAFAVVFAVLLSSLIGAYVELPLIQRLKRVHWRKAQPVVQGKVL
ncbi:acyltransferase family protein [Hydrogenophaga sp. BPS33]|uniref:acyltransferase family protein n=1 Tax=Hydrogenophaga sp. BPS33 TaxID=2651974 RepID=UPI0013201C81|nr:acyltransferase [Hydrogenophaga sp. BPS33]QHE85926.1 acyltransferase [Hydrogenophaga sp. BPS33]